MGANEPNRPAVVAGVVLVATVVAAGGPSPTDPTALVAPIALAGLVATGGDDDPLERLRAGVERLAAGRYDPDLPVDRDDGVGRLAEAIDDLAGTLREREGDDERYRRELYRISSETGAGGEEKLRRLLELGRERFDATAGFVGRIDEAAGEYEIAYATGNGPVEPGTATDLAETPWGRIDAPEEVSTVADVERAGQGDEAAVEAFDVGRYVAGPVLVDGERYGTLCFVGERSREEPFDREAETFVELATRWASSVLEQRARERELRLKDRAIDAAPIGITITDPDREDNPLVYANEAFARLTGHDPSDVLGRNCRFLQGEETAPEPVARLRSAIEAAEPVSVELRNYRADGTEFWNRVHVAPIEDGDGTVTNYVGFQQDVTERREAERRLSTLTSNVPGMVYRSRNEPDWPMEFVSDGCRELTGYEPEALERGEVAWGRDVVLEGNDALWEEVQRSLADDEPFQVVFPIETADGERRWVSEQGRGIRGEDGTVEAIEGVIVDVTERIEYERELERYETIVQAVGDPVYALDAEGRIAFVNDAIRDLAGYDPADLIGDHVSTVMDDDDIETTRDRIGELLRGEESYATVEADFETADGEVVETETHVAPLPPDDGFAGTAGVVRDVTDRKERERELERTRNLLRRVQRMAKVGGWELDLRSDPPESIWTDEIYRLHGLDPGTTIDVETIVDCYRPEDRPRVRRAIERSIEEGAGYDLEARMGAGPDETRWMRAIADPIREDGSLVGLQGAIQDVTDRKERELALESLHEAARGLLGTETESEAADLVVRTAERVLDVPEAGVYLLDPDANELAAAAHTDGFGDGEPSAIPGTGDSPLWSAFVTGSETTVEADADGPGPGVVVPIGDHGVFAVVAPPSAVDDETRRLIGTLVATAEAAFDRLESEASLRERDAELAERNRRLRRQIAINEIIRTIDQSLVRATSREAVERTVCERLAASEDVAFAWIGAPDPTEEKLVPRTWAGAGEEYLDAISLGVTGAGTEPAVAAVRTDSPAVVSNVVADLQDGAWRRAALASGFASALAVPLSFDDYGYGVLAVYAEEPATFGDLERSVFEELGTSIANSIDAIKTRQTLHADSLVELTLRIPDSNEFLERLARETGRRVEYDGVATRSRDGTRLFFTTAGSDPDEVAAALQGLVSVTDYGIVGEGEGECRFEATVSGEPIARRLVRHGASPRSIRATETDLEVVVDVPPTTDVREFVAMIRERYPTTELVGRRDVERTVHADGELTASLFDDLTDRQLEVLRTAYFAGFFEWPRESTGEDVADMLGITQPTVNRHLRLGQQRLLEGLFEDHAAVGEWVRSDA